MASSLKNTNTIEPYLRDTSMEPSNIDTFNKCVAIIFIELYNEFPVRIDDMRFNDLAIRLFDENDEAVVHESNLDVFFSTVRWLHQAGYIWLSNMNDLHAFDVTLSPKGLELLKLVPDSLDDKKTVGQLLLDTAKHSGKSSLSSIIHIALTAGYAALATPSIQ